MRRGGGATSPRSAPARMQGTADAMWRPSWRDRRHLDRLEASAETPPLHRERLAQLEAERLVRRWTPGRRQLGEERQPKKGQQNLCGKSWDPQEVVTLR